MKLFEWDPQIIPGLKMGLHSFQIIFAFVLWCLEIAIFHGDDAKIAGTNGWTFAVCFLSVPAWIYLIMTPRFSRTRQFANPYAMFAVDGLFAVLWLSAFATQAAYNSAGQCGKVCGISKAVVGLGVFITLLWAGSSLVSAYTLQYSNFHGSLPGYDNRKIGGENIDPDKAAFSMAPHDEEAYERVHMDDHDAPGSIYGDHAGPSGHYGGGGGGDDHPYGGDDFDNPDHYGAHPPRNNGNSLFDKETAYGGGGLGLGLAGHKPPSPNPFSSVHSELYDDGPAQFPSGDYDRIQH